MYFPAWFQESDLNYLDKLKKYTRARINYELTHDQRYLDEILRYADFFLEVNKPKNFNPFDTNNDLIIQEQEFEAMCAALEENGVKDAKGMTVFSFYSRILYYDKKAKKK